MAETPWLTVSDRYASFTVPPDYIQDTMGAVSLLVVEGNFGPSFNWSEFGLSQFRGVWTGTIGPLPPGLYHYRLSGDDTKVLKDPTNPTSVTSEPTWSTFLVPGDSAGPIGDAPAGRGGTLATLTYPGDAPGRQRSATVWTPPGYDARRTKPYPVLYLPGGEAGGRTDWLELGRATQILDNLSIQRRIEPMVVVLSDGDAPDFRNDLEKVRRAAGHAYHISRDPAQQALAGASTGGAKALATALAHPGDFAYLGSFAGILPDDGRRLDARAINAGTKLLRLYTGNPTDPAYNPTYRLMRKLDRAGVRYESDGVNPDVGHNWKAWQENLADFLPRLFRAGSGHGHGLIAGHGPKPGHGPSAGHAPLRHEFTTPAPGTTPTPWQAKDANGNTFVTVETGTEYADAEHVTLWGNWAPGGSWLRVPLEKRGDRWRGTIGPLKPWFYYYQFIVDLAAKKDTANPTKITTEPNWSTFLVPGKESRLLADVPANRGGAVEKLTYHSTVAGAARDAYVWTPPGYNPRREAPYPVLYLQHGGGQNYTDWVEMGRAKQILDNLSLDGKLVPMVVVMGNGNSSNFTSELIDNLVPAARARYNIIREASGRALAGLSMGGGQTYEVLRSRPGEFAYIGTFSAWMSNTTGIDVAAINNGTKLLRVYVGDVTDFVYPFAMTTLSDFDRLGIRYEFPGPTPGPHGWDVWQKNLIDFAPRLFRTDATPFTNPRGESVTGTVE